MLAQENAFVMEIAKMQLLQYYGDQNTSCYRRSLVLCEITHSNGVHFASKQITGITHHHSDCMTSGFSLQYSNVPVW